MAYSKERKVTTIKISDYEKSVLMPYFSTLNFSEVVRKMLSSKVVLLSDEMDSFIITLGVENFNDHDEVQKCVKQALFFALNNGFKYRP